MSDSDFYSILGLPRTASQAEIKKAYKEAAIKNHPDKLGGLSETERQRRVEQMYRVNEAYETLSDADKRSRYDRFGTVKFEGVRQEPKQRDGAQTYRDFWQGLFSNAGFFGENSIFGNMGGTWSQPAKTDDYFMIPESDWGLLVALKKAYESGGDGKWRVKKADDDTRRWMPDIIYTVTREGGNIHVFRVITDWRNEYEREKNVEVRRKDAYWQTEIEYKPHSLLGEFYLCGNGKDRLSGSLGFPHGYDRYLIAMKSLANKLATRDTGDISREVSALNGPWRFGSQSTRVEGRGLWEDDGNREWVRKVNFDNFWQRFRKAEGVVVQVEGAPMSKEGQGVGNGDRR